MSFCSRSVQPIVEWLEPRLVLDATTPHLSHVAETPQFPMQSSEEFRTWTVRGSDDTGRENLSSGTIQRRQPPYHPAADFAGRRGAARAPGDQAYLYFSENNVLYAGGTNETDFIRFEQIGHPLDENVVVATIMNQFGQVLAADVFDNVAHVFALGFGGNDVITNATYIDGTLYGDEGDDGLIGGNRVDSLYGGPGHDWLDGRGDDDWMWGDDGNDVLLGGYGADRMYGGADHDKLFGEEGSDTMYGNAGSDFMFGGDGPDTLYGGAGSDYLNGGSPTTMPGSGSATGFNINDYMDDAYGQLEDGDMDELWGGADADLFVNVAHWYHVGTTDDGYEIWAIIAEDLVMDADFPLDGVNTLNIM